MKDPKLSDAVPKKNAAPPDASQSQNVSEQQQNETDRFNDQDPERRLGNYGGAGEHPRVGSRNKGIVGHHDHNDK